MEFRFIDGMSFKAFFVQNESLFPMLFEQALRTNLIYEGLCDIEYFERTDFWHYFQSVCVLFIDERIDELHENAIERGNMAAKYGMPMESIMKLIGSLRHVFWTYVKEYTQSTDCGVEHFFDWQEKIDTAIDRFADRYMAGFLTYNNELLASQREMINSLSVPIISLSDQISVLPLVGTMDTFRAKRIQERVLESIAAQRIQHMVIDLSGVAYMDTSVVGHLFRIVEGINILGCKATVTGIRPEIANTIIQLGINLSDKVETKATLQQALEMEQTV